MSSSHSREKVQRFSFRKTGVGLVSATIASLFLSLGLMNAPQVQAQAEAKTIDYRYVAESELTSQEKSLLETGLPGLVEKEDQVYYLVYRANKLEGQLPKTGDMRLNAALAVTGASLLVVAIRKRKTGGKEWLGVFLLTATGASLIAPSVMAISNQVLAQYNQSLTLSVGDQLPKPLDISGYTYLGYIKEKARPESGKEALPSSTELDKSESNIETDKDVSSSSAIAPEKEGTASNGELVENNGSNQTNIDGASEEEQALITAVSEVAPLAEEKPRLSVEVKESVEEQFSEVPTKVVETEELLVGETKVVEGKAGLIRVTYEDVFVDGQLVSRKELKREEFEPVSTVVYKGTKVAEVNQPTEPATPTTPDSGSATTPGESGTPITPTTPVEPTFPDTGGTTTPVQPEETPQPPTPVEPTSPDTGGTTTPIQLEETSEPTQPTESTTPDTGGTTTAEHPEETSEPTQPTESTAPDTGGTTTPVQPEETPQPTTPVEPTSPDTGGTTTPVQPEETPQPTTPVEPTSPDTAGTTSPVHPEETSEPTQPTESTTPDTGGTTSPVHPEETPQPPTPVETHEDITIKEDLDFKTVEQANDQLLYGVREVSQEGKKGSIETLVRVYKRDGVEVRRETISRKVTPAKDHIVQVGTRVVTEVPKENIKHSLPSLTIETTESERTEEINFTIEEVPTSNLPAGQTRITRQGVKGEKKFVTKIYKINGQVIKRVEEEPVITKEPISQLVEVGRRQGTVPSLRMTNLVTNPDSRSATVSYALSDETRTYQSALAILYKGDTEVGQYAISDVNQGLVLTNLDYYTDYRIKTKLIYNLGQGNQEKIEDDVRNFRLDYKKIEIKDIDAVELYSLEDQRYRRYLTLKDRPTNLDNYFVKIKSDRFKEMLLPVTKAEEVTDNGKIKYKLTASVDQLVQDSATGYQPNFTFYIDKQVPTQNGVYTSFKELVEAIQNNPNGEYVLGADMTADEISLSSDASSYVTSEFRGKLIGSHNNQSFAIHHLTKPLFNVLNGATIQNLDLVNLSIKTDQDKIGALAKEAKNASIQNVAAQGSIIAAGHIGGLVYEAGNQTKMTNVSYQGQITATSNLLPDSNLGGVIGTASGNGTVISQAKADIDMSLSARFGTYRTGGVAGMVKEGARLEKAYAKGRITNLSKEGQTGGVIGSTWSNGSVNNVLSEVDVINGHLLHGDVNYKDANIQNGAVSQSVKGKPEKWAAIISEDALRNRLAGLGLSSTVEDSLTKAGGNRYSVDYRTLSNASQGRDVAYVNMEKLLPFYNKEFLVQAAKAIPTDHKLAQTALIDVVPMVNDRIVTDLHTDKTAINRLMLHFADNKVEYVNLNYVGDFTNSAIAEYKLTGTDILYTPESFVSNHSTTALTNLIQELSAIQFNSSGVERTLGIENQPTVGYIRAKEDENKDKDSKEKLPNVNDWAIDLGVTTLKDTDVERPLWALYLEDSFNTVKSAIGTQLVKLLTADKAINSVGSSVQNYLVHKIANNKEALLLGLAYLNRWYNINYDSINVKDLSIFKLDFFGNQEASALDTIIELGKSGYDNLRPRNNVTTFAGFLKDAKKKSDLFNYLESYRSLFLPTKSNNQWLRDNTKAKIVEVKSSIPEVATKQENAAPDSKYSLGVYDRISSPSWNYRNMLLPLLTLPDQSIYLLSTMATLTVGSLDRYRNAEEAKGRDISEYMDEKLATGAKWQGTFFDTWYRLLDETNREKLFQSFPNFEGYWFGKPNHWATLADTQYNSIRDFYGPVGKWAQYFGSAAYATGVYTQFEDSRVLDQYGSSVFTHEMVHNFDSNIFFKGHGRRQGQLAEFFTQGMLQNPTAVTQPIVGINMMFTGNVDDSHRYHAANPLERYLSEGDINAYTKEMFNLIYLLDYLEANSVLKQDTKVKMDWFRKIGNWYKNEGGRESVHAGNNLQMLTGTEVDSLKTLDDLVDKNIINARNYVNARNLSNPSIQLEHNGYYNISMMSPLYAALDNPKGSPGDLMFRRMAFELLAEKGYTDGFLPYVSSQLGPQAFQEGEKIYDNWFGREVGKVTDTRVLQYLFGTEYKDWADFKKAMYQRRIAQKDNLIDFTIQYQSGVLNSANTIRITSFKQLQDLMDEAVRYDAQYMTKVLSDPRTSMVNHLKERIYNALLRTTNDFRTSIFK
ncbi:YSIRK-type signal peptide-containing protein [Streptococcus suis]|nr:YSIRK-type signal peptide-containing protein [Streptococcus suis]NQJ77440.1 YSIRK-type signal peptide-containing protein [Streptococcus suis]